MEQEPEKLENKMSTLSLSLVMGSLAACALALIPLAAHFEGKKTERLCADFIDAAVGDKNDKGAELVKREGDTYVVYSHGRYYSCKPAENTPKPS